MATTLTIGEPNRISLGTTTEAVTVPRNARYLRIEALAHDVVVAVTGSDGGALAAHYETFPQKAIYLRSMYNTQGKARRDTDPVVYVAVSSGSGSVALTAMYEGA
tara:strand:- start:1563 stop:1877 length:315 start_codon:yes stop_codon:yes gene_type:complete